MQLHTEKPSDRTKAADPGDDLEERVHPFGRRDAPVPLLHRFTHGGFVANLFMVMHTMTMPMSMAMTAASQRECLT
jgi:hypothetical protein